MEYVGNGLESVRGTGEICCYFWWKIHFASRTIGQFTGNPKRIQFESFPNSDFPWNRQSRPTSFCLADVSKNVARHDSASFLPSSYDTARSWCKSVLLPTNTTGTLRMDEMKNVEINVFLPAFSLTDRKLQLTAFFPSHRAIYRR